MHLQRTAGNAGVVQMLRATRSRRRRSTTSWARAAGRRSTRARASTMESAFGQSFERRPRPHRRPGVEVGRVGRRERVHGRVATSCSGAASSTRAAPTGQRTIAHELPTSSSSRRARSTARTPPGGIRVSDPSDRFERPRSDGRPGDVVGRPRPPPSSAASAGPCSARRRGLGAVARGAARGDARGGGERSSPSLTRGLDQALADRVRHGVRPVAQLEARRHVVDDVLDGALGVEQPAADLGGVEAVGEQPERRRPRARSGRRTSARAATAPGAGAGRPGAAAGPGGPAAACPRRPPRTGSRPRGCRPSPRCGG